MLNQTVLVGRLVEESKLREIENGKKIAFIVLAVPRSYKNVDGEYETDFINCIIWDSIATNVTEYCKKGDLVGVKGRLQTRKYEGEDKNIRYLTEVIAEKVTFLNSSKEKINQGN